MMRLVFSGLGGTALAVALFWLLALLVTPPEQEVEPLEVAVPLRLASMAEAVEVSEVAEAPEESSPEPPAEPVEAAPVPPAELEPLPKDPDGISLPEPRPQPEPRPAPEAVPTPIETASAEPAPAEPASSAQGGQQEAPPVADSGPVDIGAAEPLSRVPPSYPRRAQRRGLEGYVELEFLIRPDGRVEGGSIRVIEARPRQVFEEAAEQAVGQWRFEADGRTRRARQRLEFQLR